ncbi:KIN12B [Symbiodinium necroappetens]|uniref:Kinesin-like protein n=1 Tax=Symbiodinium necroappetens TaxID=1628268 RepID=A0A812NCL9_9DINO|nr:KIN12B [Symbiodinium necroappetens]
MKNTRGEGSFVSVIVRARPPLAPEAPYGHCARTEGRKVLLTTTAEEGPTHRKNRQPQRTRTVECQYDKVLGMQTDQDEVWASVLPTVDKAFEGYNVTLFTYGMTGSGKTHTMLGPTLMESAFEGHKRPTTEGLKSSQQRGIVPRVMMHIFERLPDAEVFLSYLQIYQERCYDLLQPATLAKPLRIREESLKTKSAVQAGPVYVEGLTEVSVVNLEDCLYQLIAGFGNVAFRSTNYNEQSSRAHCVLTLTIRQRLTVNHQAVVRESKVRLVDLAGNERWVTNGPSPSPQHARELATINKSLHTLGNCMQVLSQPGGAKKETRHVPYRNSTLTLLLRDSLAGNSYTLMLCTICCSLLYQMQTLCTLRFADRVKRVQMKAYVCDVLDVKEAQSQMQAEMEYLRAVVTTGADGRALDELKSRISQLQQACSGLEGENRYLREQIAELEKQSLGKSMPPATGGTKATRVLRRVCSEPSLPGPDPWFQLEDDLQDIHAVCHRSHSNMGRLRPAETCPEGHELVHLGSSAEPTPAAAKVAYTEWHCDGAGCYGSSLAPDLGRYHCSLCQHDLCQTCYDQLVGQPHPTERVRRTSFVVPVKPKPEPPSRTPRRPPWEPKPKSRSEAREAREAQTQAGQAQAPAQSPQAQWAPSKKQQSLERLDETSRAPLRKPRGRSPRKPLQFPHLSGPVETSITSFASASTASTTPEPLRKKLHAQAEQRRSYAPVRGKRAAASLPPLSLASPGGGGLRMQAAPSAPTSARREDAEQKSGPLPSVERESHLLNASDKARVAVTESPRLDHGRGQSQPPTKAVPPSNAQPQSARRPVPAAMAAAAVSLLPEATDMRALLGDPNAKHAGSVT